MTAPYQGSQPDTEDEARSAHPAPRPGPPTGYAPGAPPRFAPPQSAPPQSVPQQAVPAQQGWAAPATPASIPSQPSGPHDDSANPRIDEVLAQLAAVKDAPPAQQVGPLTEAHRVLRETLDSIGDL